MVFWRSSPKTYEMPAGAVVPLGVFKRDAFAGLASELEKSVGYIDTTLVLGDKSYTLHHVKKSEMGYSHWYVEVEGSHGEGMDTIVQALMSTIGRQKGQEQPASDGKVKVIVTPSNDVNLPLILEIMGEYEKRLKGTATVSGYIFKDVSGKLSERMKSVGLPLQEVQLK